MQKVQKLALENRILCSGSGDPYSAFDWLAQAETRGRGLPHIASFYAGFRGIVLFAQQFLSPPNDVSEKLLHEHAVHAIVFGIKGMTIDVCLNREKSVAPENRSILRMFHHRHSRHHFPIRQ